MPHYDTRHGRVLLDKEGEGRFVVYMTPTGHTSRWRIGLVLGGGRCWQAELSGRRVPLRASTRASLARGIAEWAVTQLAAVSRPSEALAPSGPAFA